MDLLSVLEHELGHAAGLEHTDTGVMAPSLSAGTRTTHASVVQAAAPGAVAGATLAPVLGGTLSAPVLPGFAWMPDAMAAAPGASPLIDWSTGVTTPLPPVSADAATPAWQGDFVNHLARSEAQRNPNASLKVQVDVAPKLGSTSRSLSPTV
jgi:hypothetical protein